MKENYLFYEEQKEKNLFIRITLAILNIFAFVFTLLTVLSLMGIINGMVGEFETTELILINIFILLIIGSIDYILFNSKLITLIKNDGIYYRYIPFHHKFRKIESREISKCEARIYKPIKEYGGWGLRTFNRMKKAYSVSGNEGVEFTYINGMKLLIGSKKMNKFYEAASKILNR